VVHSWTRDVRLVVHTNWMGVARQPDMGHPMKHFAMELHSCWTERSWTMAPVRRQVAGRSWPAEHHTWRTDAGASWVASRRCSPVAPLQRRGPAKRPPRPRRWHRKAAAKTRKLVNWLFSMTHRSMIHIRAISSAVHFEKNYVVTYIYISSFQFLAKYCSLNLKRYTWIMTKWLL